MRKFYYAFLIIVALACGEAQNEYLQEFNALPLTYRTGGCTDYLEKTMSDEYLVTRDSMTLRYSFAVPTALALETIDRHTDKIVDMGGGSGYWAYLLNNRGLEVESFDNWTWEKPEQLWFPVKTGDTKALTAYWDWALLLVWPPRDGMPQDALDSWAGTTFIYVGEVLRGNGDHRFFATLEDEWTLVERVEIPHWFNRSDALFVFRRGGRTPMWVSSEIDLCG